MRSKRQFLSSRKVLVVTRSTGAAGRDLISGVFTYARRGKHWDIRLFQSPEALTVAELERFLRDGLDGLIASELSHDDALAHILAHRLPLVRIGSDPRLPSDAPAVAVVHNDEERIGAMAAEFLVSLGSFRSFAFVPVSRPYEKRHIWSRRREDAFCAHVRQRGHRVTVFRGCAEFESAGDRAELEAFLAALPKPAALMAAWDERAGHVLAACERLGIRVPDQIAVIGVDNDELVCDFCEPKLTSVYPDHIRAAAVLDALMARRIPRKSLLEPVPPKEIVIRESAAPVAPAAVLIRRALAFIETHAVLGIRPVDVARSVGVSRRLLDLRFSQYNRKSVNGELLDAKLKAVLKMLQATSRPIAAVSAAAGFRNVHHLEKVFRDRYGKSMREWRNQSHSAHGFAEVPASRKRRV